MGGEAATAQLLTALMPFRRRIAHHFALQRALDSLLPFLVPALLAAAAARIWPLAADFQLILTPLGLWLLFPFVVAVLRPRNAVQDARLIDTHLDLRERLATALALSSSGADGLLQARQRADALTQLSRHRPQALKLPLRWRRAVAAVPLLLLTAAALLVPNPQHEILRAEAERVRRQVAAAALLADHIAQVAQPDAAALEELAALAARLATAPRLSDSAALAALTAGEARVRQQLSPGREQRAIALAQLSRQLADLAQQPPEPVTVQRSAAERLEQVSQRVAQFDPAQQRAAAQRFNQLAADSAAIDPALSSALADSATALSAGRAEPAADALQRAADAARDVAAALAAEDQAQAALAALQRAREALTRPVSSAATDDAAGAPIGAVSSNAAAHSPAAVTGSPAPTVLAAPSGGDSAAPNSAAVIGAPGSEPGSIAAAAAPVDSLPGSAVAPAIGPAPAASSAPQLTATYQQRAREAVAGGQVPAQLRELVQAYFSALAQPTPAAP